jgi:hypothetical protein
MGNTFKFWLVANLGVIITVIATIIAVVAALGIEPPEGTMKSELVFGIPLITCFCTMFMCFPLKRMSEIFGRYSMIILAGIMVVCFKEDFVADPVLSKFPIIYWITLSCATVIATLIAIFVYRNFEEVVSRRMLYRNSAVEMFDSRLGYTFGQFMNISSAIFGAVILVAFGIAWVKSLIE